MATLVINKRAFSSCCCCSIACYWILLLHYSPVPSPTIAAVIESPRRHAEQPKQTRFFFASSTNHPNGALPEEKFLPFHYAPSQTWLISSTLPTLHSDLPPRTADVVQASLSQSSHEANPPLTCPRFAHWHCLTTLPRGIKLWAPKCWRCVALYRLHCTHLMASEGSPGRRKKLSPTLLRFPSSARLSTMTQFLPAKHKREAAEPERLPAAEAAVSAGSNLLPPGAESAIGNNKLYGTAPRSHSSHRAHITGPAFELAEMGMANLSQALGAGGDPHANVTFTFPVSSAAFLPCSVRQLGNQTVSWLRRLRGDLLLLTVGKVAYTGDARLAVLFKYPGSWDLHIQDLGLADDGLYECQINSHPPRSWVVRLQVRGPEVQISDVYGKKIAEQFYKVGSTVKLCCKIRQAQPMPYTVFWTRGKTVLNYDTTRGGVSVVTDKLGDNAKSCLTLSKVKLSDSGRYQCRAQDSFANVVVHVDDGAEPAAVHDNAPMNRPCHWHNIWLVSIFQLITSWLWHIK